MPPLPRPTDAELEILTVLWSRGATTVRDVHEAISLRKPTQYTTVLKVLQIMTEKGLVRRNVKQRAHIYEPTKPREWTQQQLAGDLMQRAFGGSARGLVVGALSSRKASPDDIAEIRRLLDEYEGGTKCTGSGTMIQTPLSKALGWALLHFVWEGAATALLLALALLAYRSASARFRYGLACLALAALPLAFFVTLALNWPDAAAPASVAGGPVFSAPAVMGVHLEQSPVTVADRLPWLAPLWMLGVLLCYTFSAGSWLTAQRLRRKGVCAPPPQWQAHLTELASLMGIARQVAILESCLTGVPVVIGYLRPLILMPVGMLTNLTAEQVELLLIHELAHIWRNDYLVNLFQKTIEGLLFYHPAVWWISRAVRAERENCCDDAVLEMRGDARAYAGALATLEQSRDTHAAMAANGGHLVRRIRRILSRNETAPAPMTAWPAMLMAFGAMAALTANSAVTPPRKPVPAPAQVPVQANEEIAQAVIPVARPQAQDPAVAEVALQAPVVQENSWDAQIRAAEASLAQLSETYAPQYPAVRHLQQELERLRALRGSVLLAQVQAQPSPAGTPVVQATGALSGTVQDPTGARVANSLIGLLGENFAAFTLSDQSGSYRFDSLKPGHYEIKFSSVGFKVLGKSIEVSQGKAAALDAYLQIGEISQAVTIRPATAAPAPAPQATLQRPLRIGGMVAPARLLKQLKPVYPAELQQAGTAGTVQIRMLISKEGVPQNLQVIPNGVDARFIQAALDSVKEWRYQPTTLNGEPVEVLTTVDVNFQP